MTEISSLKRKKNNDSVRPGSKVKHSKARAQHGLVQELKIGLGVFIFVKYETAIKSQGDVKCKQPKVMSRSCRIVDFPLFSPHCNCLAESKGLLERYPCLSICLLKQWSPPM